MVDNESVDSIVVVVGDEESVDSVVLSRSLAHKGFQMLAAELGCILDLVMIIMMLFLLLSILMLLLLSILFFFLHTGFSCFVPT